MDLCRYYQANLVRIVDKTKILDYATRTNLPSIWGGMLYRINHIVFHLRLPHRRSSMVHPL